jgi:hypothetical protein
MGAAEATSPEQETMPESKKKSIFFYLAADRDLVNPNRHARLEADSGGSSSRARARAGAAHVRAARARGRPERSSTHAHKRQTSGREVVIRPNPADFGGGRLIRIRLNLADSGGGRLIPVVADLFPAARRCDLDEESGSDLDRMGDSAGGLDGDGGSLDEERKLKIRTSCACGTHLGRQCYLPFCPGRCRSPRPGHAAVLPGIGRPPLESIGRRRNQPDSAGFESIGRRRNQPDSAGLLPPARWSDSCVRGCCSSLASRARVLL